MIRLSEDRDAYKVYILTDMSRYYIGQTKQLVSSRFSSHKSAAASWRSQPTPIVKAMRQNISQWTICELAVYDELDYIIQLESALIELFRIRGHDVLNAQCVDFDEDYYFKATELYHEYANREILEADCFGVEPSLYYLRRRKHMLIERDLIIKELSRG